MQEKPEKKQEKYTAKIIRKIKQEKTLLYRETFNQPQSMQHKAVYTECHGIITFGNNTKSLPPTRVEGGPGMGTVARLYQIVGLWKIFV